jgi:galactonate dehydratase
MHAALEAGYRAVQVPLPPTTARNQGQAFDKAVRTRMNTLRSAAPAGTDFVLDGSARLSAGDAASIASSLEAFHLLWFDEPCSPGNLRTLHKISDECVTPLGFGRTIVNSSDYQDLLREGVVDVLRPDIHREGIAGIRRIAAMAETYFTAVAPNHAGGPIATAAAIHLAASLPNFFIQHIPFPAPESRRKRGDILRRPVEAVRDGFVALPSGPGLGIDVNEEALTRWRDAA